jgi:hypothetical protein
MPKFDDIFGYRFNWTFGRSRHLNQGQPESEQTPSGDSPTSEPNQRETSDQDKSDYKRVTKKYKCPTEPFYQTLELIEKYL